MWILGFTSKLVFLMKLIQLSVDLQEMKKTSVYELITASFGISFKAKVPNFSQAMNCFDVRQYFQGPACTWLKCVWCVKGVQYFL